MNGTVQIHVVRHGATRMNNQTDMSQDRIRAWTDVPLSEDGRKDAMRAADEVRALGIQVIVSSDLVRAAETAAIIGQAIGVRPILNRKLRPWALGIFTGKTTAEALPEIAKYITDKPDEPVPEGESFNQFKERAFQGLAEAIQAAQGRPLAVVTHHRDERLWRAWEAAGEPPSHDIDLKVFLQKGDPPGGVFAMQVNPAALAPAGAVAAPPGQPQAGQPPMGQPQPPMPGQPGQPMPGQLPQPNPMAQMFATMAKIQKAIDLLRQDIPRGYRIDIEIDTMVAGDQQQERADATEFLGAVTKFIETSGMIVLQNPEFAPLAAKMLQWGVRRYRTGRDLESAIEEYADKVAKATQAAAGKPKPPTADQSKAQAEQAKSQAEIAKAKIDAQSAQANDQREQQLRQQEFGFKQKQFDMEMQILQMKMQHETQIQAMKMQLEQQRTNAELTSTRLQDEAAQADHRRKQAAAEDDHRRARELAEFQHRQKMTPKEGVPA